MSTRGGHRGKHKKPVQTTLGRAPAPNNNDEAIDYSHVCAPIHTSVFGLRHALNLYDTGTDEVKDYITNECDILYECRICHTIYRSLANFVLHKRKYCPKKFSPVIRDENNYEENYVEIACVNKVSSRMSNRKEEKDNTSESATPKKNLTSVLDKLNEKQECLKIVEETLKEDPNREEPPTEKVGYNEIALEPIASSTAGVFQSFNKPPQEFMKTEAMEIHSMLGTNEAILGPDGKVISLQMDKNIVANVPKLKLTCAICDLKFSTKKTLTYHIKYKHNNTRMVFICPECKDSFANAWCVFRHLYKVHRKTTTQIRKVRDQIHSSAIEKKQETEIKKKSKPDEVETINNENQWMIDFEGDNDLQMCGGCGKRFERKAALNSHSQLCMKRLAVCNTIKENSKRNQVDDKMNKQKACDQPVLKGSRKRKPNILRKTRRDIYIENESVQLQENFDTQIDRNKSSETTLIHNAGIKMEEASLKMDVESTLDDTNTVDDSATCSSVQEGSELKDDSQQTIEGDVYKRTAIEEIIFGNREGGEEYNESNKNEPYVPATISDDEDVLGFPPNPDELEINKIADKLDQELTKSNINSTESTITNVFEAEMSNKIADEITEKSKEIIDISNINNTESTITNVFEAEMSNKIADEVAEKSKEIIDVISKNCLDNLNEVINDECVDNIGEVDKDVISVECADSNKEHEDKIKLLDLERSDVEIVPCFQGDKINQLQFHEVTSINESNEIISGETHSVGENYNVNVGREIEVVESSLENVEEISVNIEDSNLTADGDLIDANSECEINESISRNDHECSTDVSGNVMDTEEIELASSSVEKLETVSANIEDLQINLRCDEKIEHGEDMCVSTKRKIIELIKSISNDHLYTTCSASDRLRKKPNILRKAKKIVKQSKLNLNKVDANICETAISSDSMAVEADNAVFEFPVRLSIEHLTNMQNMPVSTILVPITNDNVAIVEPDDDKLSLPVPQSTENETNIQNFAVSLTSPTANIPMDEVNINMISTKENRENKDDDAVINDLPNDIEKFENKPEKNNVYSLYNNHDVESGENDIQTIEDINDNVELVNDKFKLHSDRELRYKCKKQGQKRRHSTSNEQDIVEVTLELKSRKYIDSAKLVCVPCNFTFSSKKLLMRHMSLHFNWFRYQCSKCAFMSYEKLTCHQHSKTHNVNERLIGNIVMPIPNWKTISISRNFSNVDLPERRRNNEPNQSAIKDNLMEDAPEHDSIDHINNIQKINKQDPMLRKMIMEVIFGSDLTPANTDDKPSNPTNSDVRPVRSRPVVPNFQKDFVYDMKQVDTKMETRKSSFQAKVKPFKIVKSTDANFKVVHISDPACKKKRTNTENETS